MPRDYRSYLTYTAMKAPGKKVYGRHLSLSAAARLALTHDGLEYDIRELWRPRGRYLRSTYTSRKEALKGEPDDAFYWVPEIGEPLKGEHSDEPRKIGYGLWLRRNGGKWFQHPHCYFLDLERRNAPDRRKAVNSIFSDVLTLIEIHGSFNGIALVEDEDYERFHRKHGCLAGVDALWMA